MDLNMCRTCMGHGFLTNIFEKKDSKMISTAVSCLTNVNIYPSDGLPDKICDVCIERLENCKKFVTLCQNSDMKLRTLLNKNSDEESQSCLEIDFSEEHYSLDIEHGNFAGNLIKGNDPEDQEISVNEEVALNTQDYQNEEQNSAQDLKTSNKKKAVKQQCFTCGKVMSSRFRLKTHLQTHTGERPFSCSHCSKTFSLEQNLKVHLRTHTGEKPLQCPVCGKSFAHTAGLTAHKRKHTGQTPYHCVLCPRSFRTNGHLQYHVRRHTGEKNFECDTCSKAFITRSGLKQHLLTHTGVRPHVCPLCDRRLTRASHLKRHMLQAHQHYTCTLCSEKFNNKVDFDKHKETHDRKS